MLPGMNAAMMLGVSKAKSVEIIGTSTGYTAGGGDVTASVPAGTADGDLILGFFTEWHANTATIPPGTTLLGHGSGTSGGNENSEQVFSAIVDGEADFTMSSPDSNNGTLVLLAMRGGVVSTAELSRNNGNVFDFSPTTNGLYIMGSLLSLGGTITLTPSPTELLSYTAPGNNKIIVYADVTVAGVPISVTQSGMDAYRAGFGVGIEIS